MKRLIFAFAFLVDYWIEMVISFFVFLVDYWIGMVISFFVFEDFLILKLIFFSGVVIWVDDRLVSCELANFPNLLLESWTLGSAKD